MANINKGKRQPRYWINPSFRLNFPEFSVQWHECELSDLLLHQQLYKDSKVYGSGLNCLHVAVKMDNKGLDILYTSVTKFENMRLQKWIREIIRDSIVRRAELVLPARTHELEKEHDLYARKVLVKKLRGRILGQCSHDNVISMSPLNVIFPKRIMDVVILHEMAHLKYHHHRKTFWDFLTQLIGEDAKKQKTAQDIAMSKYWDFYKFLMK